MSGAERIAAERRRQIEVEGFSPEADERYRKAELMAAALAYFRHHPSTGDAPPSDWPWAGEDFKPGDRARNLEKAGALALAEIERRTRAGKAPGAAQKLADQAAAKLDEVLGRARLKEARAQ